MNNKMIELLDITSHVDWSIKDNMIITKDQEYQDIHIEYYEFDTDCKIDDLFDENSEFIKHVLQLKDTLNDTDKDYVKILLSKNNNYLVLTASELPMKRLKINPYVMLGEGICYLGILQK